MARRQFAAVWVVFAVVLAVASSLVVGLAVNAVPKLWGWAHDWWLLSGISAGLLVAAALVAMVQARSSPSSEAKAGPVMQARRSQQSLVTGSNTGTMISAQTVIIGAAGTAVPEPRANAEACAVSHDMRFAGTVSQAVQKDTGFAREDHIRTTRLLIDAKRAAESITQKPLRAAALAATARALAATEPDRATRLIADAEHITESIADVTNEFVLVYIIEAVAVNDPDRAERIAQSISDERVKGRGLADIARAMAATDPDRVAQLITDAERIAEFIVSKYWKAGAFADIAWAVAATDPDHAAQLITDAERVAQPTSEDWKDREFVGIAKALAATDPDHAERIAQFITNEFWKVEALVAIAEA